MKVCLFILFILIVAGYACKKENKIEPEQIYCATCIEQSTQAKQERCGNYKDVCNWTGSLENNLACQNWECEIKEKR